MKERILLENIPSGQEYLADIIEGMKKGQCINMTYQSYWRDESNTFIVEPYCVKLFKQRWYVAARSPYYNKVMIYSLDRILHLELLNDERFKMQTAHLFQAHNLHTHFSIEKSFCQLFFATFLKFFLFF
jgi:predicted DNA-binding transcriptional regulator YafY